MIGDKFPTENHDTFTGFLRSERPMQSCRDSGFFWRCELEHSDFDTKPFSDDHHSFHIHPWLAPSAAKSDEASCRA